MQRYYYGSSIPNQAVKKKRKKNDDLAIKTVDALERIGYQQVKENQRFNDYYDMIEGKLVWADYTEQEMPIVDGINTILEDSGFQPDPFVKHYDILGLIINQMVGEWLNNQEEFNIDCVDEHTQNEFLRERTRRLQEFVRERFELEVQEVLIQSGIDPNGGELSPEQQEQLLQQVQQVRDSIKSPDQIDREMKDWKTQAVSWGNGVVDADSVRFRMEELVRNEMVDYCVAGRFFRNYFIGFDYYRPERWDVRDVFFSREKDATKPQDREYVGRQTRMPIYQVRERYGHLISNKELEALDNYFGTRIESNENLNLNNPGDLKRALFGHNRQVPFYNYDEYEKAIEVQELTGVPRGFNIVQTPDGEVREPYYLPLHDHIEFTTLKSENRNDFEVRRDTVLVTEGYYRSYERKNFIRYRDQDGIQTSTVVTDDILPEFIKENGLKKDNNKSLIEVIEDLEAENIIFPFYEPVIRGFVKINMGIGNKNGKGAIYHDDILPYQIKGDSELVDKRIPVGGIIDSNIIADKIRPYQVMYNINLNQITDMMAKELGLFYAFDIRLLPSEIRDYGDTEEVLERVQDFIKTTSLVPLDYSKGNTGYNQSHSNSFMPNHISYANDIAVRMNQASYYKQMALEQIGITPQRMGTPDKYETAEGVKQGVTASFAQTEGIFNKMTQAALQTIEVHLAVAQHCQKNYKDADFVYTKSDGSKGYIYLSDDSFPLRRFGVFPINSSKNKRRREQLVQALMQLNTLGSDVLDYAEVFLSDSVQEVLDAGRKARNRRIEEQQKQQQQQQQIVEAELTQKSQKEQLDREFEASENEKDRQARIRQAQLQALGRASYTETTTDDANINRVADEAANELEMESLNLKNTKIQADTEVSKEKMRLEEERINLEREKIAQKRESDQIKENIARINWRQ